MCIMYAQCTGILDCNMLDMMDVDNPTYSMPKDIPSSVYMVCNGWNDKGRPHLWGHLKIVPEVSR